jgi:catechol 2,3-dioxygenase-like lactoylglutathione lyase family enzyme
LAIQRIESVVYGVEDVPTCVRFFEDFGLELVETDEGGATFRTPVNQKLHLRRLDDESLPPALEEGSTLREVTWGVDTPDALAALAADLAADRDVRESNDGAIHTTDESGYAIAFAVEDVTEVDLIPREPNVTGSVGRWNSELTGYGRARPIRVCHLALNIAKEGRQTAEAFYAERLNFRPVDRVLKMGTFMQCEGDWDQHNFLLCHRPDVFGINHTAWEVRDFDEVVEGGNYMLDQGWEEARLLGRHTVGSNVFRFFHAPCGGRVEYAADMSRVDDSYETPRVHEETPPHHIWVLKANAKEGKP